jgi:hypothetical protein
MRTYPIDPAGGISQFPPVCCGRNDGKLRAGATKVHTKSVNKWRKFEKQLRPLKSYLESAGIDVH